MTPRTQALLRDVDVFLKLTGMKPTNFGRKALNDPAFYGKLRKGRRLWDETEERVRRFIEVHAERIAA